MRLKGERVNLSIQCTPWNETLPIIKGKAINFEPVWFRLLPWTRRQNLVASWA
jgi:hypothetical protein